MENTGKDLVIIGSGPAGLSAAVYAKRAKLDVVVLEKDAFSGGQIVLTDRVDNYLGLYGENGFDLAMKFKSHADALQVPFQTGEVEEVRDLGTVKEVQLASGQVIQTKAILIATGASHKNLGCKGEKEFTGMGVSYCATCDGAFFRNKTVVVVGGGDVALGDALYLANLCEKVYLVHRREGLRASKALQDQVKQTGNIEFLPYYEVKEIHGEGKVESVELENNQSGERKTLDVSGIFVAVGMEPKSQIVGALVALDKNGYIQAGEDCRTSAKNIYAAGDVRTKQVRQVITAVADGAVAIASLEQDTIG